jgi:hypothetical protein
MGTYNVIGLGEIGAFDSTRQLYEAQNRTEIMQQRSRATKKGDRIVWWYAQTAAGVRVLGPKCLGVNFDIRDGDVPSVHVVTCPYCHGRGQNGRHYCPVCNGSGLMQPGHDKRWQQWQLDNMKAEADEAEKATA